MFTSFYLKIHIGKEPVFTKGFGKSLYGKYIISALHIRSEGKFHIGGFPGGFFQNLYFIQHFFAAFRSFDGFFTVEGFQLFNNFLLMADFSLLVHVGIPCRCAQLLLFYGVIRIISRKNIDLCPVYFDNLADNFVQEKAVMGDNQYGALII